MSDHDNNIDDIKEKLKKKRQDTEFNGYTPKKKPSAQPSKNPDAKDNKIKSPHEKTKEEESNKKTDKSSTESSLTIEHYSDFDKKENHTKSKETVKEEKEKVKKDKKSFKFKKIHAYIIGLLILLLILITILWYVFSSASDVKEIKYNGNSLVSEEELEERIGFGLGSKMFSISLNDAE